VDVAYAFGETTVDVQVYTDPVVKTNEGPAPATLRWAARVMQSPCFLDTINVGRLCLAQW